MFNMLDVMELMWKIREWFFCSVLRARWIIGSDNDLGLRIMGVNLYYYKSSKPIVSFDEVEYREVYNKEFGHSITPPAKEN